MDKYKDSKGKLKEFADSTSKWKYIKNIQKEVTDHIINILLPRGDNAISVPYGAYWFFPLPKKRENLRGYRSRLAAWAYLYILSNFTERMDNEEEAICGIVSPNEIPEFCLEGFSIHFPRRQRRRRFY